LIGVEKIEEKNVERNEKANGGDELIQSTLYTSVHCHNDIPLYY
jgi:hypothetical protein